MSPRTRRALEQAYRLIILSPILLEDGRLACSPSDSSLSLSLLAERRCARRCSALGVRAWGARGVASSAGWICTTGTGASRLASESVFVEPIGDWGWAGRRWEGTLWAEGADACEHDAGGARGRAVERWRASPSVRRLSHSHSASHSTSHSTSHRHAAPWTAVCTAATAQKQRILRRRMPSTRQAHVRSSAFPVQQHAAHAVSMA